jgi:hypothetical protein
MTELHEVVVIPSIRTKKQSLSVGTERYSRYVTEELHLLPPHVPVHDVKDVEEICTFRHCHELPIRCVADAPNGCHVPMQNNN